MLIDMLRPVRLLIVSFFLFSMNLWSSDETFHCSMQMLPFLLKGQRQESTEPRSCRLEDRLQKTAKRLREEVGLPVPNNLRHQGELTWRSWSLEEKTVDVQLVRTPRNNHLRLTHCKDTPPKATVSR